MYKVTVTSYSLHVRTKPHHTSKPVAWIHKGNTFSASKKQNGWYYIDAKKGWSNGSFLKVQEQPKANPKPPTPPPKPNKTPPPTGDYSLPEPETYKRTVFASDSNLASSNNMASYDVGISSSGDAYDYMNTLSNMKTNQTLNSMLSGIKPSGNVNYKINPDIHIPNFNENMKSIRENLNIFTGDETDKTFTKFNRFKIPITGEALTKTVPYVFFTRPSLNMVDLETMRLKPQYGADPLYTHVISNNRKIIDSLGETLSSNHTFNPFLSNSARSFEPQDEIIKTTQVGETYTGWKIMYGRNSIESRTAGQFNIQYQDNKNADIYKMHKVWTDYINKVYRGAWRVRRSTIERKVLNYASSLYYIVTAADGETILYWSKYFGVFPINAPGSAMSWSHGPSPGMVDFVVNYVYSMKEDYSPISLLEFNMQSNGSTNYRPVYSKEMGTTTHTFTGAPFVEQVEGINGRREYKLRFRN